MATKQPKPTPPKTGTRTSIRVDDQLSDDLAVLMTPGGTVSDAIRTAVGQLADMYRTAWARGVVPHGTAPTLLAYQLQQRPTPHTPLTSRYDAPSDPRPTPRVDRPLPGGQPRPSAGPVVTPAVHT
ncbi:hypothetical protein [Streptomyces sp. ML-6]|uniref:hypothetical protein n=1 Tax=Streptomyces sp. ML-6 TaxID=2982693 RepID=UPI0024C0051D|nr:hypothetical protein [Streptomyces sp. ML-6]MDK0520374.1 hypothetical protein [Streptomyces sp. ML-6]